jgi:FMN phosphatase YigB (HAD superfamily)
MRIDSFICDYGGVVSDHYCEPFHGQLAATLGVSSKKLRELLSERSEHGRAYRLDKITMAEFWTEVCRLSNGACHDHGYLQEMWAQTYIPNTAVLIFMKHLKEKVGVKTGIVMNEDRARAEYVMDRHKIHQYASIVVTSCDVGFLKPDIEMFKIVLTKFKRQNKPSSVLYIDDRESHVNAAKECGMQVYRYNSAGEMFCFLEDVEFVAFDEHIGQAPNAFSIGR